MPNEKDDIQGQELDKPLQFKGEDVKLQDIKVTRTPYALEQHEFYILTKSNSELKDWRKRFLQIGFGVLLTILSKTIYILYQLGKAESAADKGKIEFSLNTWEIISLFIAFGTSLILHIICQVVKTDKDKLIDQLKVHYKI